MLLVGAGRSVRRYTETSATDIGPSAQTACAAGRFGAGGGL